MTLPELERGGAKPASLLCSSLLAAVGLGFRGRRYFAQLSPQQEKPGVQRNLSARIIGMPMTIRPARRIGHARMKSMRTPKSRSMELSFGSGSGLLGSWQRPSLAVKVAMARMPVITS